MTFSRQARAQLMRYGHIVFQGDIARRVEIMNYHQWFWSKIWAFRSSLGLPADLALSTEAQQREDVEAAMLAAGLARATVDAEWTDYARAAEFVASQGHVHNVWTTRWTAAIRSPRNSPPAIARLGASTTTTWRTTPGDC